MYHRQRISSLLITISFFGVSGWLPAALASDDGDTFYGPCVLGSTVLLECGGVNETTTIKTRLGTRCDYVFTVNWGDYTQTYNINNTDLVDDSNGTDPFALSDFFIERVFEEAGTYTIRSSVSGYSNLSSFNEVGEDRFSIREEERNLGSFAVSSDSCEDISSAATGMSDILGLVSGKGLAAMVSTWCISLAWLVL